MANEKRLIDVVAFIEDHKKEFEQYMQTWDTAQMSGFASLLIELQTAPRVDAVEVIRCRDCKYFSRDEENNRAWCNYYTGCIETAVNGYCYHGKKMDGGNEDGSCNSF